MKFKNKLETGRSMVEIIGVLAVVGVLSVGGIMGYSYGMDRHKANETVKGLTLRALDIQSQVDKCSGEICDVSIDGWEDDTPYTITMEDDGLLRINEVPSRVCKIIGDLLMDSAAVYVEGVKYDPNSTTDPCDTRDNHALFFDFDPVVLADMDDVGHLPEIPALTTEILYASHPGNEEEEETTLFPLKPDIDCNHNGYLFEIEQQGLNCETVCSNRKTYNGGCVLKCENGFLDIFSGTCYSCDTPEDVIEVEPSECAKCSNRESYPTAANDGCRLKEGVYSSDGYEETSISGDILESTENPEIIVCPSVEPGATYCNQEAPIWVDPNDVCDSTRHCLNREMQGDYSVKLCNYEDVSYDTNWRCPTNDMVYSSGDGGIVSTEIQEETTLFPVKPDIDCYVNSMFVGELALDVDACLDACPNRTRYLGGCVLPCPNGFYDSFSGTCHSCDTPEDVIEVEPWECAKCSNRESYPTAANSGCRLKGGVYTSGGYEETTLFPVEPDEFTSSVESEETTVVVISKPIDLIARLKSENPSCPDPYYDSVTQTVYYYAEWDPWDKCAVRTCTWEPYVNDWMCQG